MHQYYYSQKIFVFLQDLLDLYHVQYAAEFTLHEIFKKVQNNNCGSVRGILNCLLMSDITYSFYYSIQDYPRFINRLLIHFLLSKFQQFLGIQQLNIHQEFDLMANLSDIIAIYHPVPGFKCNKQATCPLKYCSEKPNIQRKKHTLQQRQHINEYNMHNYASKGLLGEKINFDKKRTLINRQHRRYNSKDFDNSRSKSKRLFTLNSKESIQTSSTNDLNINCMKQVYLDINSMEYNQKKLDKEMCQNFKQFSQDIAKIQFHQQLLYSNMIQVKKQLVETKQTIQKLKKLAKVKSTQICKQKQNGEKQRIIQNLYYDTNKKNKKK